LRTAPAASAVPLTTRIFRLDNALVPYYGLEEKSRSAQTPTGDGAC
jgi:hypothetical protein